MCNPTDAIASNNSFPFLFRCVDLRTGAFDVPPQEILTRDSVTINVDAVVYYQVNILVKKNIKETTV